MRWQLAQNTLVVVSIALAFGKHIGRFKLDAIGIEQFRTLPNHTLVFARRTAGVLAEWNTPQDTTRTADWPDSADSWMEGSSTLT